MKAKNKCKSRRVNSCNCNRDDTRIKIFKDLFQVENYLIDHMYQMTDVYNFDLESFFKDMLKMMIYWHHSNEYQGPVMFEPEYFLTPFMEESSKGHQLYPLILPIPEDRLGKTFSGEDDPYFEELGDDIYNIAMGKLQRNYLDSCNLINNACSKSD